MEQPFRNLDLSVSLSNLIAEASALMLKGDYKEAVIAWEEIIAIESPQMPNGVWARLASAHRKLQDHIAVLDIAVRAKDANKSSSELHAEVATALVNAKQEDDAIKYLVDEADRSNDPKVRLELLNRVTMIEAGQSNVNVNKAVKNTQYLIDSYYAPLSSEELKATAAFTAKQARRLLSQDGWEDYWNQRKNFVYLHVCRRLIEIVAHSATAVGDIGSNRSPILDYFGAKQTKYSVDIENPYRADDVISVTEDFYTWQSPETLQVGTCFQVIEHVPDPAKFCRRMLELFEVSIISVPYLEPSGVNPGHINNDINLPKLVKWFDREPNFHYIARELSGDERIICIFDKTTTRKFLDMHKSGSNAQRFMYRWSLEDFSALDQNITFASENRAPTISNVPSEFDERIPLISPEDFIVSEKGGLRGAFILSVDLQHGVQARGWAFDESDEAYHPTHIGIYEEGKLVLRSAISLKSPDLPVPNARFGVRLLDFNENSKIEIFAFTGEGRALLLPQHV